MPSTEKKTLGQQMRTLHRDIGFVTAGLRANRKKLVGLFQIALSVVLLVWLLGRVGVAEVVSTLARIN